MNAPRGDYKAVWEALSTSKEEAYFYVAGYQDEEKLHHDAEVTVDVLRETVGIRTTDVCAEIGCGIGRVGRVLAPLVREWIGCDVSSNMLRIARRRLLGIPNIRLLETTGYDLRPLADASLDMVYATVLFMHLDAWDRYNYVREAFRILRPGGRFYCDNVDLASAAGWAVFEENRLKHKPQERPAHITDCSTRPEIETYLCRAGFDDVRVEGRRDVWVCGWGRKPGGRG